MNTGGLISGVENISRKAYEHKIDMFFHKVTGTKAVLEDNLNDSPSKLAKQE